MSQALEPREVRRDDSPVIVEMSGSRLLLKPRPDMDREDTEVFVDALEAAMATGVGVLLELVGTDEGGTARLSSEPEPPLCTVDPCTGCNSGRIVSVIAAGVIGLVAAGSWWTIDLARRRLARTDGPVDFRFLGADAWSDLEAVWFGAGVTRAVGPRGTFLTSSCGESNAVSAALRSG